MRKFRACLIAVGVLVCLSSCNDGPGDLKQMAQLADRVNKQYRTADYATAKVALVGLIRELEFRQNDPSNGNAETYKGDIMISYVRLAKLEEKNNGSEKEHFMRQAAAWCEKRKIKRSCSAEDMRAQVDAADSLPVK